MSSSDTAVATPTPTQFVTQAAEGGLAEVQLSQLAAKQAQNPEVKQFAQRMIADHGKANTELKAIAGTKKMNLPKDLNAEHKAAMKSLQGQKGAAFDTAYMAAMQKDHEKTIALFQAASSAGFQDQELKVFATRTLPVLQEHHQMVQQTSTKASSTAATR